jgi:hypothetical protein
VKLTTHLQSSVEVKNGGAIPSLSHTSSWGQLYFYLYQINPWNSKMYQSKINQIFKKYRGRNCKRENKKRKRIKEFKDKCL